MASQELLAVHPLQALLFVVLTQAVVGPTLITIPSSVATVFYLSWLFFFRGDDAG